MKLLQGEVWKLHHNRKGEIQLQIKRDFDFDNPIDVWIDGVVVDKPVKGLVNVWEPGEDISVRGEWVRPIEKVGEPLKTTEERHAG